ncbi:MAG: hypothetical protein JWP13_335 [Candidatus Saccharibacteria bacterium]|nr:hypothetical protein [Candidatus Saccharibacteria bacterium]
MNNDFNFRPSRPAQSDSSTEQTPNEDTTVDQSQTAATGAPAPQPQQQVVTSRQPAGKFRRFIGALLLILLLAAVAGGVYYWQQATIKNLNTTQKGLHSEVASLETELAKEKASSAAGEDDKSTAEPATTYNILSGSVTNYVGNAADVSVQYLPGPAKEVWVEYGTKPDDLKMTTKHMAATSAGTTGSYNEQVFALTSLQAGTQYFYRAAGTIDGKTVYGGIVAFKATK